MFWYCHQFVLKIISCKCLKILMKDSAKLTKTLPLILLRFITNKVFQFFSCQQLKFKDLSRRVSAELHAKIISLRLAPSEEIVYVGFYYILRIQHTGFHRESIHNEIDLWVNSWNV